ncbi:MAG: DUF4202 domain-containing protein [Opitutales bacterium]|jgi:hypothetical protein|nr:DUF4202 domain-containing protein [Opitutales bacterium]MDP4642998.1 DUF4202 domain-containing protein [Opitutales bacterium]MDP4778252.1 DUF4202 domain-containing protein [Opitutales bacterium]MDP4884456.1 DUF4202 domain-containing protein [Opitutales bacterium]
MSFQTDERFKQAIDKFDALNAQDTNLVGDVPKELHDALAMTRWLEALYPDAGEVPHLAARCQHLCRWERPRSEYPEGRTAYLQWRSDLKKMHAEKSASVLKSVGYTTDVIDAVVAVNLKQGLKSNADVQMIEDALCLVFLENQFEGYIGKWEDDKIVRILQKTWGKMSEVGHGAALRLPLSDKALSLVQQALA